MLAVALDERPDVVQQLFNNAPSLTARWYVMVWFGHSGEPRQGDETRVLTPEATQTMSEHLRERILQTDVATLISEPRLLTLLGLVLRDDDDEASRELLRTKVEDGELFVALLVNSMSYADWWPALIRLIGEEPLRERLAAADERRRGDGLDEDATAAVERAVRKAAGEADPID